MTWPNHGRVASVFLCASCGAFAQSSPALHDGFVTVPGAKIFYRESGGSGVPVVFLHATTGQLRGVGEANPGLYSRRVPLHRL
jgi:hypothetical protein